MTNENMPGGEFPPELRAHFDEWENETNSANMLSKENFVYRSGGTAALLAAACYEKFQDYKPALAKLANFALRCSENAGRAWYPHVVVSQVLSKREDDSNSD